MSPAPTPTGTTTNPSLKDYEDKVRGQIRDAKAKLEEYKAKAAQQRTQVENKTIERLNATQMNLEQKVQQLKTTQAANLERAKANIDAEVAKLRTSIDELTSEYRTAMKQ